MITMVISHGQDQDYLDHFLKALIKCSLFPELKIWIDGWGSLYTGDFQAWKISTHKTPHGERCFDVLSQIDTEFVFIVDSDFFCSDNKLWGDALKTMEDDKIYAVSLGQQWNFIEDLPTTPFMLYRRKEVIDYLPVKELWNHFGKTWPVLKQPVFDYMKFLFLSLYLNGHTKCIDKMNPSKNIKYKHYHFWDSRDLPERNFREYDELKNRSTTLFLTYGLCKYFFKHIIRGLEIGDQHWKYADVIMPDPYYSQYILDFFRNMGDQLSDPIHISRFFALREIFYSRQGNLIKSNA